MAMQTKFMQACVAVMVGAGVMVADARDAHAQERFNPRQGLVTTGLFYRATVALRLNPLGLFFDGRVGYRMRLFNAPDRHVLLRNTYAALGVSVVASPAFVRPGIALEVQPLQILNLQVIYEPVVQWFGSFGHLQSFDDVRGNFSDAGITRARTNPVNVQSARGSQFTLQATLQARIGSTLALRNTTRMVKAMYDTSTLTSGRTRVYYDPFYDVVAPTDGWTLVNDFDLIAQLTDAGANIGLRYSVVSPMFDSAVDDPTVDTTTHRVGPIVTWTLSERRHSWFNAPTVFMLAQWWIRNQWRTGNDHPDTVSRWAPMFILGFSFRGDM
jgi:hypothetical protein